MTLAARPQHCSSGLRRTEESCWDWQRNRMLASRFTRLQGQYLAFIVAYTKLNRRAPAEADFQRYFEMTPASIHNMIVTLERCGLITRRPGRSRSIEVLVPLNEVPPFD